MRCKLNYPIHNLRTTVNAKLIYGFKETMEQYEAWRKLYDNNWSQWDSDEPETYEQWERSSAWEETWNEFEDNYFFRSNGYESLESPRCDDIYGIPVAQCYVPLTAELNASEIANIEETDRFKEFKEQASKYFNLDEVEFHLYLMLSIEDGVGDICIGFDDDDDDN